MPRLRVSALIALASLAFAGCAQTIRVGDAKSLVYVSRRDAEALLGKLGYPNNISADVSRSRNGDRLFVQFDDHTNRYGPAVRYKVAIVSAEGIVVKDLPGETVFNDAGEPVCWSTWGTKTKGPRHFRNGYVLPEDVHNLWSRSDGEFMPMFREHEDHWWIARVESPLQQLVTFDCEKQFELLISNDDKLHVFVRGKPEGKPRKDRWFILKHYEYRLEGGKARLLQIQDFYYTWSIWDFDPETNMMFARSWDTMFAHGLLVNTASGKREDVRGGSAWFLKTDVGERFRKALRD